MIQRATGALIIVLFLASISACSMFNTVKEGAKDTFNFVTDREPKSGELYEEDDTPIIDLNSSAADKLYYNVSQGTEMPEGSPLYVKSFTNEDNPGDKSRFGRIVANQVAARLAQHDLLITDGAPKPLPVAPAPEPEPIKTDSNATENGELFSFLSNKKEVTPRPAMLTGTYFIGDTIIYMNAKIIRLEDDVVISGHSWTLPINDNTRELLPQLKRQQHPEPLVKDQF